VIALRVAVGYLFVGAVATSCLGPQVAGSPSPSAAGAPLPPAPTVSVVPGTGNDQVVAVVQELLPSVVTVINKLPSGQPQGSGSGFVIDASRGFIVTNNHVVENVRDTGVGASFDVVFADDRRVEATLVGRDPQTDIAVLQVPAQNLRAATLGDSDAVPVGSTVVAIGSPLGEFQNTVTAGIVSAKGRRVAESPTIFLEDLVQTDAAINQGNSGGPLIWAATRQVIGMNTLVARVNGAEGLGFAISSNTIRQIVDELIKNGRVVRGSIGIQYVPLSRQIAVQLGLPAGTQGIVVTQTVSGSAAERAGLRANDVITKVNDQPIDPEHPLQSLMVKFRPGDKVTLTLIRDGQQRTVDVTLGQPLQ
jgi:2-alkenal reductase